MLWRVLKDRLPDREFVFEVEHGVYIPGDLDDYMVRWSFFHGLLSDSAFVLSRRLLRPGDVAIDVGANIGLWCMGAARRVGPSGRIYAVEPDESNYARLVGNIERNGLGWIFPDRLALADRPGPVTMYRPRYDHSGHPTLGCRPEVDQPMTVPAATLDEYCAARDVTHVDFLKSDVEGAELLVLRGGARLLGSDDAPIILFEVNEDTAAQLGFSCADVKACLAEYGYRCYDHADGRLGPEVAIDRVEPPHDLLALKPAHHARAEAAART
ncbi:MAG: FkbM family methyltransferase [Acidimicrobiia bacterium]|nr:FkbM family methyltransferase [Acidimicrobiia bacterium]